MLRLILEAKKEDTGKVNCLAVSGLRKVLEVNLANGGIDVVAKGACLVGFLLGLSALFVGYFKWKVPVVSTYWKETAVGGFSTGVVAAGLVYECRSGNSGGKYYFHGDADGGLEVSVFTQGQ